ncbi:MAG: hypothetical protein COX70_00730, partial [Flavobacteriales bacterium CG_4_10_14_0_2_um_filter_32_8]
YVILIVKDGEVKNSFNEGVGIIAKINEKTVTGRWYFKAEPDVVVVVGDKGQILGEVKLNEQKTIKLETEEQQSSGGGMSFGIGIGPIGVSTGGGGGGPTFISYNMEKNEATFDQQKETKEEKIRREYNEKREMERQNKEIERQANKDKKKGK